MFVGMWISENISRTKKKKRIQLSYFTGFTSEDRHICRRANILIFVVYLNYYLFFFNIETTTQVNLNTALFKDNQIRMLQICNYNSEPQHKGQICELSLNLKLNAVWKKFSADLGQLLNFCGSHWQFSGQSQVSHWDPAFAQTQNSLKIQRL